VFYLGNFVAYLAAVDFLPTFGIGVYPFGFAIVTTMFTGVVIGALRYRLIDVTPEIAAAGLLETMPDAVLVVDRHGVVRLANRAATRLFAVTEPPLTGRPLDSISTDPQLLAAFADPAGYPPGRDLSFVAGDGHERAVALFAARIDDRWGEVAAWVWLLRDLTDQRRAEDEKRTLESWLRQSQRMESLGVMAGGIAHDFNNLVTTIVGSVEVLRRRPGVMGSGAGEVERIGTAAEHAAELTQQLLTYAGRTTPNDESVDLNALVRDMADSLRAGASRQVAIVARLASSPPRCRGDRGQLRQVLLNLVTNASEAIGERTGHDSHHDQRRRSGAGWRRKTRAPPGR
jgi:PAS domain S-box-containing protein